MAELACLHLTEAEVAKYSRELSAILNYINQLQSIVGDSEKPVEAMNQAVAVLAEDAVRPSLPQEEALASAPADDGEFFLVPRVLGR